MSLVAGSPPAAPGATETAFLGVRLGAQLFGLPLLTVRDVLGPRPLTRIPLAPKAVAGALNVRGRIITAIDMRARLGLGAPPGHGPSTAIVVEHEDEAYALIVDAVGEVLAPPAALFAPNPPTLDPAWRACVNGIVRLDDALMLIVDVGRLLAIDG